MAAAAAPLAAAERPRLVFGIISDMHIVDRATAGDTVRALRYFRNRNVDAVVMAGDMIDNGLSGELENLAEAWFSVFPGGKGPDGRKVELLAVLGNHDLQYWCREWADEIKMPWSRVLAEDLDSGDRLKSEWKRLFGCEYEPLWKKRVNGVCFVGSSYQYRSDRQRRTAPVGGMDLPEFLAANSSELAKEDVFFFVQHMHPKGTCSAPWTWGQDDGTATEALRRFPNAIALSGHSHTPLNDERTLWRGEFTSVGTAALKFLIPFGGRENSEIDGAADTGDQLMPRLRPEDGKHGMVCRVYRDRVVFERRDFANSLLLGDDWTVPVPGKADSFSARAARSVPPEFAAGAEISIATGSAANRKGERTEAVFVSFPNVLSSGSRARAFDFEIQLQEMDVDAVKVRRTKRVYSAGYYKGEAADEKTVTCPFAVSDLPAPNGKLDPTRGRRWRFAVRPCDCFGNKGKAICTKWHSQLPLSPNS